LTQLNAFCELTRDARPKGAATTLCMLRSKLAHSKLGRLNKLVAIRHVPLN
jgi:hypothetical protein